MLFFFAVLFVPAALAAKCCGPSKFSGVMHMVGATIRPDGTPNIFDYDMKLSYDYDLKMARTDMMIAGRQQMSLIDYNNNVTYSVYDGFCTKNSSFIEAQSPCVPDEAQFAGSQVMGSANASLAVDTWRLTTSDLVMKITVTKDTCTIVQESMYGNINGEQGESTYIFSDLTEGALANGVFNVPPECRYQTAPLVG
ncbi:uncharacterized protein LOC110451164 isoform X2 [Mizuhopecten yessoensis]|uniref:Mammalian ependymin-related protein 1 n=1 Tax=Mizuhopecten yessoensis TaxID=6573 RepID=A0A210QM69_MIZYE|nr:uncharacterized protein LOC110451164 isoform X2 [Mizuhopecten yessoensis]OWF49838.1 hypothetical protein KP79_PYT05767 [Mizuhopecten yessoensis]